MNSTVNHPTREQHLNGKLHLEDQIIKRMNWLRANKAEEIAAFAKEVKETLSPSAPMPAKINLVKSPVYRTKKENFVNLDEELDGEGYYLAQAAGAGHVEIPA
jgi:hypothetical protein